MKLYFMEKNMNIRNALSCFAFGSMLLLNACNSGGSPNANYPTDTKVDSSKISKQVETTASTQEFNNQANTFSAIESQKIQAELQESSTGIIYAGSESGGLFIKRIAADWEQKTMVNGLKSNNITSIAANGNSIFVIAGGYPQVSHDGGNTWALLDTKYDHYYNSIVYSDGALYTLASFEYYSAIVKTNFLSVSYDEGKTWQSIDMPKVVRAKSLMVWGGNLFFVDTWTTEVYYSTDKGVNWRLTGVVDSDGTIPYLNGVATDGKTIVIATDHGVGISTDNLYSLVKVDVKSNLDSRNVHGVSIINNTIYAATDSGYSISTDLGKNWTNKSLTAPANSIFVNPSLILIGTNNNLTYSYLTAFNFNIQNIFSSLSHSGNILFVGSYESGMYMYDNTTSNTKLFKFNGQVSGINSNYVNSTYIDGSNLYVATVAGLAISQDNGNSWMYKDATNGLAIGIATSVAAKGSDIYVGTYTGGLAISNNGGSTWRSVTHNNGLYGNQDVVNNVYLESQNVYVSTNQGLSVSADRGASWSHYLNDKPILQTVVVDEIIYAATNGGIYVSSDLGKTWVKFSNNLDNTQVKCILVYAGVIYVGLDNGKIAVSTDKGQHFSLKLIDTNNLPINALQIFNNSLIIASDSGLYALG